MLQRLLGGNSFKRPAMINCSHSNLLTKLLTALFINLDNLEDNDILASGLIKTPKFPELTMDRSLYAEENYELDSRSSVENQINRPNAGGGFSSFSRESAKFSQTVSGTSSFSETHEENSSCDESLSPEWPVAKYEIRSQAVLTKLAMKQHSHHLNEKSNDQETSDSEMEMMKERFSKLLLGEDMSGSGKGVCTAIAISNAITNLYATVFGQCLKLEPLSCEKKSMWKREMDCLFSVCDYIVEFAPFCQSSPDGSTLEVMTSRPRADICINLPALQKLDAMLLEILDSFCKTEFWYIDQGILSSDVGNSGSFRRVLRRQEEKWWLPIPCVPSCGLSEKSRKHIQNKRECASQIHKAAMAINSSVLAEMAVPETYLAALPKSGKASLGDQIHRYITTADKFSPDYLLDHLNLKSEHEALELADRVEAAICIWQRKICANGSRSSWVKDLMVEGDKMEMLGRAETLLLCLKQRYPGLPQTTLDTSKIQYNKDVGQAILESYSRVLESLAFNIVAWIQDVLYANRSEITLKLQQFQVQSSSMNCII